MELKKLKKEGQINSLNGLLGIGKNVSQNMYFFSGIIDEVKVWSAALTTEQLMESMEGAPEPSAAEPSGKLSVTWGEIKH